MQEEKIKMVCGTCGSENVKRDAWAVWDEAEQKWVLGPVFDDAFCDDCDRETEIKEVPLNGLDLKLAANGLVAMAKAKETDAETGTFPCPHCQKGTIQFSKAPNGHTRGQCDSEGCIAWIE